MPVGVCIHGLVALASSIFFAGFAIGGLVAWDCLRRLPKDRPDERGWSEVPEPELRGASCTD